jgi:hypothetical protein
MMGETELDLDDLDLGDLVVTTVDAMEAKDVAPRVDQQGTPIIWDIETGPRPWSEIEQFYEPPGELIPWSDDQVKYGNLKDPTKRAEKYAAVKAEYLARLAGQEEEKTVHRGAWLAECALDPVTGQVLAIGYLRGETGVIDHGDERKMLENFWNLWYESAKRNGSEMIGYNTNGFDLPFLVRRSWLLKVEVPGDVLVDGRYWSRLFIDLMLRWGCGQRGFAKLDRVAAYFGTARKSGSGADFARLYHEDQAAALQYLMQDLRVTEGVARAMGVI